MKKMITKKLEEICLPEKGTIISGPFGSNIGRKYFVEEGIPVIRGNNLSLSLDKFYDKDFVFVTEEKAEELNCYAEKYDLIFTAAGTLGQVGIIPEDSHYDKYVISNKQIRARVDRNKVDVLYAYYWFSSPWIQKLLSLSNKGSTVPLLSLWEVKNLPISFPESLKDQQEIVRILETISQKIDNNNKINSTFEAMIKTIYDYWFLQFEFPNEEGKPYKSSGGKMVWNEELKREIPEGWSVCELKDTITLEKGISYTRKNIESGEGVPMINLASIDVHRNYKPNELKYFQGAYNVNKEVHCGDMLIACTDLTRNADIIGSPILVPNDNDKYIYSMDLAKLMVTGNQINPLYLYMTLRTDFYHNYIKGFASGTNVLHLNTEGIVWFRVCIPSCSVQDKFAIFVDQYHNNSCELIKENQELTSLRDFLLPLLMNGQVSFKE